MKSLLAVGLAIIAISCSQKKQTTTYQAPKEQPHRYKTVYEGNRILTYAENGKVESEIIADELCGDEAGSASSKAQTESLKLKHAEEKNYENFHKRELLMAYGRGSRFEMDYMRFNSSDRGLKDEKEKKNDQKKTGGPLLISLGVVFSLVGIGLYFMALILSLILSIIGFGEIMFILGSLALIAGIIMLIIGMVISVIDISKKLKLLKTGTHKEKIATRSFWTLMILSLGVLAVGLAVVFGGGAPLLGALFSVFGAILFVVLLLQLQKVIKHNRSLESN